YLALDQMPEHLARRVLGERVGDIQFDPVKAPLIEQDAIARKQGGEARAFRAAVSTVRHDYRLVPAGAAIAGADQDIREQRILGRMQDHRAPRGLVEDDEPVAV